MSKTITLEITKLYTQPDGNIKPRSVVARIELLPVEVIDQTGKKVRDAVLSFREICDGFRSATFGVVQEQPAVAPPPIHGQPQPTGQAPGYAAAPAQPAAAPAQPAAPPQGPHDE